MEFDFGFGCMRASCRWFKGQFMGFAGFIIGLKKAKAVSSIGSSTFGNWDLAEL